MKIHSVLSRVYVRDMEAAIAFYEEFLAEKCGGRFAYAEKHLEIARIGPLLIVAGTDEALAPFRGTSVTMRVDSIHEAKGFVLANGGQVITADVTRVPTGLNMTARHADGLLVEYVQFT